MPIWASPFCLAGAGVALLFARSTTARIAGGLMFAAGVTDSRADIRSMALYGAIGIIVAMVAWVAVGKR